MSKWTTSIKDWLPALAAVCAVVLATCYAVSRKARAAEEIHEMTSVGSTLLDAAKSAQASTMSQEDIVRLKALKVELERRMDDAREPSLVQAELMQSASKAGVVLRELRPHQKETGTRGRKETPDYPRYRVLVGGTYAQIAEYMRLCTRQRLPARVTEFRLRRTANEDGIHGSQLIADIIVEAFHPRGEADRNGNND